MADDFMVLPVLSANYAFMWPFMVVNITLASYYLYKLYDVTYISNYLHALPSIDDLKTTCIASICLSTATLFASLYFVYRAMGGIYKAQRKGTTIVDIGTLAELTFPIALALIMVNLAITSLLFAGLNNAGHISNTVNYLAQIPNIAIFMAPFIVAAAIYCVYSMSSFYTYSTADKKASTDVINNPVSDQSNMGYTPISSDVDDVLMSAKSARADWWEMSSKNEEATPLCI